MRYVPFACTCAFSLSLAHRAVSAVHIAFGFEPDKVKYQEKFRFKCPHKFKCKVTGIEPENHLIVLTRVGISQGPYPFRYAL